MVSTGRKAARWAIDGAVAPSVPIPAPRKNRYLAEIGTPIQRQVTAATSAVPSATPST